MPSAQRGQATLDREEVLIQSMMWSRVFDFVKPASLEKEEQLDKLLLRKKLIRGLPDRSRDSDTATGPTVKVKGKPLSESIREER